VIAGIVTVKRTPDAFAPEDASAGPCASGSTGELGSVVLLDEQAVKNANASKGQRKRMSTRTSIPRTRRLPDGWVVTF
jgi:hypothetical protein